MSPSRVVTTRREVLPLLRVPRTPKSLLRRKNPSKSLNTFKK
jgi:hypothetical protein